MNVLIVDDQRSARLMLRQVVRDINPYISVVDFERPLEALTWSQQNAADLVLLDYRMPEMNGLQFAKQFRRPPAKRDVPIILISVVADEPMRQAALDAGVTDVLVKPVRPRELFARCKNLLGLRQHAETAKERARLFERRVMEDVRILEMRERETMLTLARAMDLRLGAGPHVVRTARLAALIAERMQLTDEDTRLIELAAPLHDLGMVAIPDSILLGTAPLDDAERRLLDQHPRLGWELLRHQSSPVLRVAAGIALSHHERWDGRGYPERRGGAEIPLAARIVAVADVFDALISKRPYREAWSMDAAVAYMRSQAGAAFDPACICALLADPPRLMDISRMKLATDANGASAPMEKLSA